MTEFTEITRPDALNRLKEAETVYGVLYDKDGNVIEKHIFNDLADLEVIEEDLGSVWNVLKFYERGRENG